MSIRTFLSALIISAEVMTLAACSGEPADIMGSPKSVSPPAPREGPMGLNLSDEFVGAPFEFGFVRLINDNGDAAGEMKTDAGSKPFVWMASGEIKEIELPAGVKFLYHAKINSRGQVIGLFR